MRPSLLLPRLVGTVLAVSACGGNVIVDATTSGTGSGGAGSTTSTTSSSSSVTSICPPGTCIVGSPGTCEEPTGPSGNACCACGADGMCSAYCDCASPDTPIATPSGERAIASLRAGDLVYSVDGAQIVAVPILATHETLVAPDHRVMRVRLSNGATIEISGGHPTLDGRSFAELRQGGQLGGVGIVGAESIPYGYDRTFDILPASDSGGYFAGGVLIGSTLKPAARVDL